MTPSIRSHATGTTVDLWRGRERPPVRRSKGRGRRRSRVRGGRRLGRRWHRDGASDESRRRLVASATPACETEQRTREEGGAMEPRMRAAPRSSPTSKAYPPRATAPRHLPPGLPPPPPAPPPHCRSRCSTRWPTTPPSPMPSSTPGAPASLQASSFRHCCLSPSEVSQLQIRSRAAVISGQQLQPWRTAPTCPCSGAGAGG